MTSIKEEGGRVNQGLLFCPFLLLLFHIIQHSFEAWRAVFQPMDMKHRTLGVVGVVIGEEGMEVQGFIYQ